MKIVFYLFFSVISNTITTIKNDENVPPIIKNETDIEVIQEFQIKYKLLKNLQNNKICNKKKIDLIHNSGLFINLNDNKLKAPNLCKGLDLI